MCHIYFLKFLQPNITYTKVTYIYNFEFNVTNFVIESPTLVFIFYLLIAMTYFQFISFPIIIINKIYRSYILYVFL